MGHIRFLDGDGSPFRPAPPRPAPEVYPLIDGLNFIDEETCTLLASYVMQLWIDDFKSAQTKRREEALFDLEIARWKPARIPAFHLSSLALNVPIEAVLRGLVNQAQVSQPKTPRKELAA